MRFRSGFLRQYLMFGPMSLAIYRTIECEILSRQTFEKPVLDIGCGDGHFAGILFSENVDLGIDPQEKEINKARTTGMYDELIVCFGDRIPKPNGSFRTIFSNSTLEHIPNVRPVIQEAARLLAPGGYFFVTIPTDKLQRYSLGSRFLRKLGLESAANAFESRYNAFWKHYNALPERDWEGIFTDCGLEVESKIVYCPATLVAWFDGLLPFSIPSYLLEKITGRWLFSKILRKLYVGLLVRFVGTLIARDSNDADGALVFYALKKPTG
jgi:SAM-dependent methyltransferase